MEYPFAGRTEPAWMDMLHDIVAEADHLTDEDVVHAKRLLDEQDPQVLAGRSPLTVAAALLWEVADEETTKEELCDAADITRIALNNVLVVMEQ